MKNSHSCEYDSVGFPLIRIDELNCFAHLYPVTKFQFEVCISNISNSSFGQQWYSESVLRQNKRISPHLANRNNYWELFITGLYPNEAITYSEWCGLDGEKYDIPTLQEWNNLYQICLRKRPVNIKPMISDSNEMVSTIVLQLDAIFQDLSHRSSRQPTLADQMFLRLGVTEWVKPDEGFNNKWAGIGEPDPRFDKVIKSADQGIPRVPANPFVDRLASFGFRLMRR